MDFPCFLVVEIAPRMVQKTCDPPSVARDALCIVVAPVANAEPDHEAQEIEMLLGGFLIHLRKQRHRIVLEGPEHGWLVSVKDKLGSHRTAS